MWGVDVTEKMQVTEDGNGWFPVTTSNGNIQRKKKLYLGFQFMTSVRKDYCRYVISLVKVTV